MKKITLISGANKGIGGEIAKKFASEGHNLILLVHNFSEKNSLIKKFKKKYKINIKYFVGDLKKAHRGNQDLPDSFSVQEGYKTLQGHKRFFSMMTTIDILYRKIERLKYYYQKYVLPKFLEWDI